MDLQNMKALIKLMEVLGFPSSLDRKLIYYHCLHRKEFSIHVRKLFGDDVVNYHIFFKENIASGNLACTHYDAFLRKNTEIESSSADSVDLQKLDERMKNVNWDELSQFVDEAAFDLSDKESWKQYAALEGIILDLENLAFTNEGRTVSDHLKYKYWADSSLESMIPNLYLLKSKLEFTQRFYIVGEEGITADEAVRFLNNKWLQRQMQLKTKNPAEGALTNRQPAKSGSCGKTKGSDKKANRALKQPTK